MKDLLKIEELRERRAKLREVRENDRLRTLYGGDLAAAVGAATGRLLSIEDFGRDLSEPLHFDWPQDLADAEGLVATYIGKSEAERILSCVRNRLGMLDGVIGFHDKPYMGLAKLGEVDPVSFLLAADSVKDSVIFYSNNPVGVILVDCYVDQPCDPFSIVVQGDGLVQELRGCFGAVRNRERGQVHIGPFERE